MTVACCCGRCAAAATTGFTSFTTFTAIAASAVAPILSTSSAPPPRRRYALFQPSQLSSLAQVFEAEPAAKPRVLKRMEITLTKARRLPPLPALAASPPSPPSPPLPATLRASATSVPATYRPPPPLFPGGAKGARRHLPRAARPRRPAAGTLIASPYDPPAPPRDLRIASHGLPWPPRAFPPLASRATAPGLRRCRGCRPTWPLRHVVGSGGRTSSASSW